MPSSPRGDGADLAPGNGAAWDGPAPAGAEGAAGKADPGATAGPGRHRADEPAGPGRGDPGRGDPGRGDPGATAEPEQAGRGRHSSEAARPGQGHDPGGARGPDDTERIWRALEAEGLLGETEPDVIQAARRLNRSPAGWVPARGAPAEEDEHFVPPVPPPLPKLDPLTKMAWTALFGGPGYLMLATAAHWSVPGYAAFFAVAAFVTGFALLVLRMNEPGPGGPGDGDDGAVV